MITYLALPYHSLSVNLTSHVLCMLYMYHTVMSCHVTAMYVCGVASVHMHVHVCVRVCVCMYVLAKLEDVCAVFSCLFSMCVYRLGELLPNPLVW